MCLGWVWELPPIRLTPHQAYVCEQHDRRGSALSSRNMLENIPSGAHTHTQGHTRVTWVQHTLGPSLNLVLSISLSPSVRPRSGYVWLTPCPHCMFCVNGHAVLHQQGSDGLCSTCITAPREHGWRGEEMLDFKKRYKTTVKLHECFCVCVYNWRYHSHKYDS